MPERLTGLPILTLTLPLPLPLPLTLTLTLHFHRTLALKVGETYQTANGVSKLLVWLLASVAAESNNHRQLIVSDPRQASALLKLLRQGGEEDSAGQ